MMAFVEATLFRLHLALIHRLVAGLAGRGGTTLAQEDVSKLVQKSTREVINLASPLPLAADRQFLGSFSS